MGAVVGSLSKGATLWALDIALIGIFVFGLLFLVGWIAEEIVPKEHRWYKYRTLFIVMAIGGVAGEWVADIADFALSEHLENIVENEANERANRIDMQAGDRFLDPQLASKWLKNSPKGTTEIWYKANDREAYMFALQINGALTRAGWTVLLPMKLIPSAGGDPYFSADVPSEIRWGDSTSIAVRANLRVDDPTASGALFALSSALGARMGTVSVMGSHDDPKLAKDHFVIVVEER
jgi:hypothetical protein